MTTNTDMEEKGKEETPRVETPTVSEGPHPNSDTVTENEACVSWEAKFKALEAKFDTLESKYSQLDGQWGKIPWWACPTSLGHFQGPLAGEPPPPAPAKEPGAPEKIIKDEKPTSDETKKGEVDKEGDSGSNSDKGEKEKKEEKSKEDENPPRAIIMVNRRDPDSGERRDFDVKKDATTQSKTINKSAFKLVKHIFSDEEKDEDTEDFGELTILDNDLKELLRSVCRKDPLFWHTPSGNLVMDTPLEPLILNWEKLKEEANRDGLDEKNMNTREDLKLLLKAIEEGTGDPKLDDYMKRRESFIESNTITFDALWTIFAPGTLVLSRPFPRENQVFIANTPYQSWPQIPSRGGRRAAKFDLWCCTYDWTGFEFERRAFYLQMDHFEGTKPISALPTRPFTPDMDGYAEIKKDLIERGKEYVRFCTTPPGNRMFSYEGKALLDHKGFRGVNVPPPMQHDDAMTRPPYGNPYHGGPYGGPYGGGYGGGPQPPQGDTPTYIKGHVMVDFDSYLKYALPNPALGPKFSSTDINEFDCNCSLCQTNEVVKEQFRMAYDGKKGTGDEVWTEEQYMMCPPRVLGYALGNKQWVQLSVRNLTILGKDSSAFEDRLQLQGEDGGKETKDLLIGLVENHGNDSSSRDSYELDDIVPEKGKGLVILLYGPPGVGKTSTAQTIALAAGKPLFSVTVTDIGTSASLIETNFQRIFDLATTWKAVLLIDEADVFLQSRGRASSGSSTERNALVSVFLRVLEYYQGILILTTNQIAQFDIAVQSRIHIALRYEELDKDQTIGIFMGFLEQYRKKGLIADKHFRKIKKEAEGKLWKERFDGRQIRNIVTSAMGLAIADEKRSLEWSDVQQVIEMTRSFKTDLDYQMKRYLEQERGGRGFN
ncbi:AAA family ATPase [Zalerion maritima]|uniref:AAA family ATPase n=1 Tax=Zalerion maritima TaxID=339359 RepID=A0AAD5RRS1_9PEZI|nr:AAA family ATPase [Zalerion maritima]